MDKFKITKLGLKRVGLLLILGVIFFSGKPPLSSTWAGTASNQLLTGAALRDGATATGWYTVDVTIPAGDDLKICTSEYIEAHTNASGTGSTAKNCPTKATFSSQF